MSFSNEIDSTQVHTDRGTRARLSFSSHVASDGLREGDRPSAVAIPKSKIKPPRRSVFREIGLDDVDRSHTPYIDQPKTPTFVEMAETKESNKITLDHILKDLEPKDTEAAKKSSRSKVSRPSIKAAASAPPALLPTFPRVALIVLLICVVVPGFRYSVNIGGVDGGVIRAAEMVENGSMIEGRQNSPTAVCTRWAHQSTLPGLRLDFE